MADLLAPFASVKMRWMRHYRFSPKINHRDKSNYYLPFGYATEMVLGKRAGFRSAQGERDDPR
jgi:hypothetical protein